MAYIECNLSRIEKRVRSNGTKYIVCTWVGSDDAANGPVIVNGRLNLSVAKARNTTLTKCLFPATEEVFQAYWNRDTGLRALVRAAVDEATGEVKEKEQCRELSQTTKVGLCYERVPLENISREVRKIGYIDRNGTQRVQNYINVIGWGNEDGSWSEDISKEDMALNNLNSGLMNGTYTDLTHEDVEVTNTPTKLVEHGKLDDDDL